MKFWIVSFIAGTLSVPATGLRYGDPSLRIVIPKLDNGTLDVDDEAQEALKQADAIENRNATDPGINDEAQEAIRQAGTVDDEADTIAKSISGNLVINEADEAKEAMRMAESVEDEKPAVIVERVEYHSDDHNEIPTQSNSSNSSGSLITNEAASEAEDAMHRAQAVEAGIPTDMQSKSLSRGFSDEDAEEAKARAKDDEDQWSGRVLCSLTGNDGRIATVRLQPGNNERSLVLNDDAKGSEIRVRCEGAPDARCLARSDTASNQISDCPECPCETAAVKKPFQLNRPFAVAMAEEVDKRCISGSTDSPFRVLLVGLGAGELATHITRHCDDTGSGKLELETVAMDSRMPDLAHQYFGLPQRVKVTVGEALPAVQEMLAAVKQNTLLADQRRFDVVLVDCFSVPRVLTPEQCRSAEFVQTAQQLLRKGGVILQHLMHTDDTYSEVATDFNQTVATYQAGFTCPGCDVSVRPLGVDGMAPDSIVVASAPADSDSSDQ